jgi:Zn-dependent protease
VFLFEPSRTDFDLSWRMFGIPVRVHPMFWLMGALTGWSYIQLGFEYVAIWIACVFVSVLIHELGHVFMGRVFGSEGHIVLYGFGGLAIGSSAVPNRWQRVAVLLAGPMAGFLYLGVLALIIAAASPELLDVLLDKLRAMLGFPVRRDLFFHKETMTEVILEMLVFINLLWGLMNLLPVWPLDGGQITREIATGMDPRNGERIALGISAGVAGLIAIHGLMLRFGKPIVPILTNVDGGFLAIMFGLLAFGSIQALQQVNNRPWREDYPSRWERDDDWRPRREREDDRRPRGQRDDDWRR